MKHPLLILSLFATLFSCKKEHTPDPEPGTAEHTLTRSFLFPGEGIRLDTAYTTQQIPATASMKTLNAQQGYFSLYFGTLLNFSSFPNKDFVAISIPLSKLRPGVVGDYEFSHTQLNGTTYTPVGDVKGSLYLRYYPKQVAILDANGTLATPGVLRITAYDAKRHLISGNFSTGSDGTLALSPLTTGYAYFKLQLTGSFTNLPVEQ
ncbi:hypothetical protein [Hymenobacter cellulosilyticus]|uniref:Uncharacterized protein n=1 Tax=Hymenobacter cellulosilyticus TaxID=2932248 RepID=A0A8T9QCY4_9BACT|nr:hypothetical protein [Hymenobacter cellulosilyticus]UOQ72693.1 hypothetical protein MUN79_01475 [Hymenobacter cellulosilyticus]